jgi:UDP-glucose 4-epimerase
MPEKVVVFGAAGFVGKNMVHHFRDKGLDIMASDFVDSPFTESVPYKKIDISNKDEVTDILKGSHIVIHLAASPLTVSLKDPLRDMQINVNGTLNIMEASREEGVELVIFSSASSVVGTLQYNPVDEHHPCEPRTPYAASKLAVEHYLRVYKEIYGLNHLIFRFFNIYGPWQYPASGGLIPVIINRLLNEEKITIFGDGSATRDFVYVGDVVDLYSLALEKKVRNETLNMGTGVGTSIMDIVSIASEVLNKEPNIEYKPKREGEIDNFYADTKKLERTFESKPNTGLREGLEKTYLWFSEECV